MMPRLYREAPVNSIWEGCGNVICLDILRAMKKDPEIARAVLDEARLSRSGESPLRCILKTARSGPP